MHVLGELDDDKSGSLTLAKALQLGPRFWGPLGAKSHGNIGRKWQIDLMIPSCQISEVAGRRVHLTKCAALI